MLAILQKVYSLSWQLHQTAGQNAHFLHFLACERIDATLRHNSWRTIARESKHMAQTTTDTAASTVSGAGAASSFSGGTGTEAEFGSLGALSPTWWEPEDGSEPEPWLTPDQAFERFFEWTSDRGIELWDHQEEAQIGRASCRERV